MAKEPLIKRTIAFFDGQNLFHAAREAFGYTYPNYDPLCLAKTICAAKHWQLTQVRFYTGVPDPADDRFWYEFWSAKLGAMGRQGIVVYSRSLHSRGTPPKDGDCKGSDLPAPGWLCYVFC